MFSGGSTQINNDPLGVVWSNESSVSELSLSEIKRKPKPSFGDADVFFEERMTRLFRFGGEWRDVLCMEQEYLSY